jgi:PmbA protein
MQDNKPDISSLAKFGLRLAQEKNRNLKCAEFFFNKNKYINIELEENSIKNNEIGLDAGVSIRLIDKRGSLGFAFTNNLEKKPIEKMIHSALNMMQAGTKDPDFKDLPHYYKEYPNVNNLFDNNVKNIQMEDSLKYAEELINICKGDDLAVSQSGGFTANYTKTYIFNSNGIEVFDKNTIFTVSSNIIVKDKIKEENSFGFDWQSETILKNLDAMTVAKNALTNAKRNLGRKKIKSMKVPLILTPNGTISFILNPIAAAANAEAFQYKRSFLVGKKEQVIGSEHLNIEDNGLIDGASGSAAFDDEGVPCKNKEIFNKGKFLNILHNSYTAGKDGVESTGNASRKSYSSIPSIGITNLSLKSGDHTKEELLNDIKSGIMLDYTGDSPNITTGDFSGLILQGNLIKNGEIKEPLNETMFGINLLDLFKNIDAVSKEFKIYGSFRAPYVKIKGVQIIGAAL